MWKIFLSDLLSAVEAAFVSIVGHNGSAPFVLLDGTVQIKDDRIVLLCDEVLFLDVESLVFPELFSVGPSQFSNDLGVIAAICKRTEGIQYSREYVRKGSLDCDTLVARPQPENQ